LCAHAVAVFIAEVVQCKNYSTGKVVGDQHVGTYRSREMEPNFISSCPLLEIGRENIYM
jgi:hypothetical protein